MRHSRRDTDGGWRASIALPRERERVQCLMDILWTSGINLGKSRILPLSSLLGLPFNLVVTVVIANTPATG